MRKNCILRVLLGWLILVVLLVCLAFWLQLNYAGKLRTDIALLLILASISALFVTRTYVWQGYSLPWLKCPDCNSRGWIISKREIGPSWVHEVGVSSVRFARQKKWWKFCARCQCEFDDKTRTIVEPDE